MCIRDRVVKADSLDGLAKLIGARPEVLAKTVERFNLFTEPVSYTHLTLPTSDLV